MKYLPPCAFGNCILRSRRLPWACAFPRVGNLRGGTLISRPDGAAERADQRTDREQCGRHRGSGDDWTQSPHERLSPALGVATCTFCPSSSESDGLMMI